MTGTASILSVAHQRTMLDPRTYDTCHTREYWLQCGRAAMAAVRLCCNLTPAEIAYLRRDRWMPESEPIVRVLDTFEARNRDIPVIDAARIVVARYIDATPEELRTSRYLFVTRKSLRLSRSVIIKSLNRAAQRAGICDNFMEVSASTFTTAVYADPIDDGAALVLTGRSLADAGYFVSPPIERLRGCLEENHPLREMGRIAFFESQPRLSKLAVKIRSCTQAREIDDSTRQSLRQQHLPEAVKLFDEGLVTQVAVGHFFGLDRIQIHMWFKRYRKKGRDSLVGRWSGCLTPEWRRKTMQLYAELSPIKSRASFYRSLTSKYVDFPFGIGTVTNFLNEAGEKCSGKERMTVEWRKTIDSEFVKFETQPKKATLMLHLQKHFDFPYTRKTLETYLDAAGLVPILARN